MVTSNLELYEELKPKLGEKAARMIADVIPVPGDIATKTDIDRLERAITGLELRIDQLETRILRWTLSFFMPLWVAVLAALVIVLLRT